MLYNCYLQKNPYVTNMPNYAYTIDKSENNIEYFPFLFPFIVVGAMHLCENSDYIYNRVVFWCNSIFSRIMGTRRFDRHNEEIFRELDKEYGKKVMNFDGKYTIAKGYYNDDMIRGPGEVSMVQSGLIINTRGIYKNNFLNGPGTCVIEKYDSDNNVWIQSIYTGTFCKNKLHKNGKFENKFISVTGEFKNGLLQNGDVKIKKFNEEYMDSEYRNVKEMSGIFDGMLMSNATFVNKVKQLSGTKIIEYDGETYNYEMFDHKCIVKNRNVVLRNTNNSGFEFEFPDKNKMLVDQTLKDVEIIFSSGDVVKGTILNDTHLKDQIKMLTEPIGTLNPNELDYFMTNVDNMTYTKADERCVKDMNHLEFSYWLCSNNRSVYEYIYQIKSNITGDLFMSFTTVKDFGIETMDENILNQILKLQKEQVKQIIDENPSEEKPSEEKPSEESEESDDSIVIISSSEILDQ